MQTRQREVFDRIAEGWYSRHHWTRFRRELEALAKRWVRGRMLNVGCGHGADFTPFRSGFDLHGIDFSIEMLRLARKYERKRGFRAELVLGDAACLPFADGAFDWAIAIASYHHISGAAARRAAFRELRRVLKPGGEAYITVWNRWQPRFWLKRREVLVPWRRRGETLYRYYYLFSYPQMARLLRQAGFEIVPPPSKESRFRFFARNVRLLVRKPEK